MQREVVIHGIYRHFKGDYYLVEDVVRHSETKEKYVLYRALYGDSQLWVRPYEMFLSEVDHAKYPNVKQKYRFALQKSYTNQPTSQSTNQSTDHSKISSTPLAKRPTPTQKPPKPAKPKPKLLRVSIKLQK